MDASTAEIGQSTEITENLSTQTIKVDSDIKRASVVSVRNNLNLIPQAEVENEQAEQRLQILKGIDQKLEQNLQATEQGNNRFVGLLLRNYTVEQIDIPYDGTYNIDMNSKVKLPWYINIDRQRLFRSFNKNNASEDVAKIGVLERTPFSSIMYRELVHKRNEITENLSGITAEQIKRGVERSFELNMQNSMATGLVDVRLYTPEEAEGIKKNLISLSEIPDEKWIDRRNQINPYFFIHNNLYHEDASTNNSENSVLIQALSADEIPKETLNRLDLILKLDLMITEYPPGSNYLNFCDTSPSVLFSPDQAITDDQLKNMLEIGKAVIARNKESSFNLQSKTLYENLNFLKQIQTNLPLLYQLFV